MRPEKHAALILEEFTKQAENFGKEGLTLSNKEYLAWAVHSLKLKADDKVLDVAAGTGHLSREVAPRVKEVWAIDATPAMIEQGISEAQKGNIFNIHYIQGLAEELPFADKSFDIVMSRLAFHHFVDPLGPFKEMVRVCKENGYIVIMDLLSPKEPELREIYNELERLRDLSHTYALTAREFADIIQASALKPEDFQLRDIEVALEPWLDTTSTTEGNRGIIVKALSEELNGKNKTGMRPFYRDGEIKFLQTWALMISRN